MVKRSSPSLSQRELAEQLGISDGMVSKLKARGMPTASVEAARAWRVENLDPAMMKADRPPAGTGSADPQFVAARLRRAQAMAEIAELRAGEDRGDLIRAADARRILATAAIGCRQIFERAPGRWAHQLLALPTSRAVHSVLEKLCAEALAELHAALDGAEARLPTEAAGEGK